MRSARRLAVAAAAALLLAPAAGADPPATPVKAPRYAEHAALAARSLLIALAAAGERLVAVGDRGVIVLSDDGGASWRQAASVPTQALLTGVCFFDARHGIAVGHDEVAAVSDDGGENWRLAHDAPEAQRPLLDVWCGAGGAAIAVGAYSAYLVSTDRGTSWSERAFTPAPAPQPHGTPQHAAAASAEASDAAVGGGYHLNRIVGAADGPLYIAAEAGHLYRSDDTGVHWRELASPYAGSFFDILPLAGGGLLAGGMRGNLYRSQDGGQSWGRIDTGTLEMLDGAARLPGGTVVVVGLSGVVLLSRDDGRSFTLDQQSDRSGLSAALAVGNDAFAVVGEGGARRLSLSGGTSGAMR